MYAIYYLKVPASLANTDIQFIFIEVKSEFITTILL